MRRATAVVVAFVLILGVFAVAFVVRGGRQPSAAPVAASSTDQRLAAAPRVSAVHTSAGFLYGRVDTIDGATYEGRLRWGGDQEAFWGDFFDGTKHFSSGTDGNPWAVHLPPELQKRGGIAIFGFEFGGERPIELRRQFLARFGDIARVEAEFAYTRVQLKSGTIVPLDRFAAGDIDDGVRVWDESRGAVNLDARRIRTIEFLPTPPLASVPDRLHGTVRTRHGEFSGFIQWNQQDGVGTDTLDGHTGDSALSVPYDRIVSIVRHSRDSALVTERDGRTIVLTGTPEAGRGNRGIYVDDTRYGRVLISWDAFERVEFSPAGSGPAYDDFSPGNPLAGSVTTRDGRRLAGRLVYDLDETETTETLDASSEGVSYAIPFERIASIAIPGRDEDRAGLARVILRHGEELSLERSGDLDDRNAGVLIFVDGREHPEYVPWIEIERIDLDRRD